MKRLAVLFAIPLAWALAGSGCYWSYDDDDLAAGDDDAADDDAGDDDSADDDAGDDDAADDDEEDDDSEDDDDFAHPPGYDDPDQHGQDLKDQVMDCRDCHGADLNGGPEAPSCDDCHEPGWRTNCVYCHGGMDNNTGAPPVDLHDATSASTPTVGAHSQHITGPGHPGYDCDECHTRPSDVLSPGHVFDATAGTAEVNLGGGLSPSGSFSNGGCSGLYCHGNRGQDNGSASNFTSPITNCNTCHPDWTSSGSTVESQMSGSHGDHLEENSDCSDCHGSVINDANSIIAPQLHVDGNVSIQMVNGGTWNSGNKTCSVFCHGENHYNDHW
jgi:hypothetical protein